MVPFTEAGKSYMMASALDILEALLAAFQHPEKKLRELALMQNDLLLFSNTTMSGMKPLEHALEVVQAFLDGESHLLFVPYAKADYDHYTQEVQSMLAPLGVTVEGVHTASNARQVVE